MHRLNKTVTRGEQFSCASTETPPPRGCLLISVLLLGPADITILFGIFCGNNINNDIKMV